jgi:hypothetical protein
MYLSINYCLDWHILLHCVAYTFYNENVRDPLLVWGVFLLKLRKQSRGAVLSLGLAKYLPVSGSREVLSRDWLRRSKPAELTGTDTSLPVAWRRRRSPFAIDFTNLGVRRTNCALPLSWWSYRLACCCQHIISRRSKSQTKTSISVKRWHACVNSYGFLPSKF